MIISDVREQFRKSGGDAFTVWVYWDLYYSHGGIDSCTLCGGSGILDTSDKPWGKKNFCICLEGQSLRKKSQKKEVDNGKD
jgi:hypothetical protein